MKVRNVVTVISTLLSTAAATLVLAPSAHAATHATACGSTYSRVGHYPLSSAIAQAPDPGGWLDIYYSSTTGKNCAVAYPISTLQPKTTEISISIRRSGTAEWFGDSGPYHYYAGPAYISARGVCIDALGDLDAGFRYHGGFYGRHCG
ncbi:hypothetical protein ACWGH4_10620 [Streptomyces sp. NPDC054847]